MVELFFGKKGKGKTKYLLDDANKSVADVSGSVVYLDKSTNHMHELSNQARLINVTDYKIDNADKFMGFVCGIISQDYDLQIIYCDSFLKMAHIEVSELLKLVEELDAISKERDIRMCISVSADEIELDEKLKKYIKISL